ncbi:MAG: family 20 glycosylhydrolase [Oscillospiraceae bacterium]|nr:family 20 glycosylhydrolase [Oscillospiraceae bacterium]
MKIGRLNDFFDNIPFSCHFAETALVPEAELVGDPMKAELLQIRWAQIRDEELALDITLPQAAFVDTIALHFGPKTAVSYAKVVADGETVYVHTAETGKGIKTPVLNLTAGVSCQALTVILSLNFSSLQLENIELFGALEDGADLFPTPDSVVLGEGNVPAEAFTGCCASTPEAKQAAAILCEKWNERKANTISSDSGNICFAEDAAIAADGYTLEITEKGATICASNLRGFVYGAESFIKLAQSKELPLVRITDRPFKAFRGVHLFIPSEAGMDFAKRLIKYVISPMGYNTVILQVSGGMIYERHPEISAAFAHAVEMRSQGWPAFPHNGIAEGKPITKALLKEYIAYIRSFGIDVIPEVQSLAHVQYLTHAFPEIAEIAPEQLKDNVDTTQEDKLPSTFYHHDYCPSNPRTYEILFDVIDEIIEVFEPREFVHMGHDEVRSIGVCPHCKDKTPTELFAGDINKIHAYLAQKGLRMMIWGDMLQPMPKYPTHPAIDLIPKDIVILDFIWYFHLDKDIEDNLLSKDFQVLIGNLYSSHFPRYETRIRKEGLNGGQISAWVATTEKDLQQEGKLYDFHMTAQLLWAESYQRNYFQVYDRLISSLMPKLREDLNNIRYPSRLPGAELALLGENADSLTPEFTVGGSYSSLIFRHCALRKITRQPWLELDVVANYIITYTDGEKETVPVTYGGNVGFVGRKQNAPIPHSFYRHTGYTATYFSDSETRYGKNGEIETTYIYEYLPKAKPIASICVEQNPAFEAKVLLKSVLGVK